MDDQLSSLEKYAPTLLHEATHALTGTNDETLEFEQGLTESLGKVATWAIMQSQQAVKHEENGNTALGKEEKQRFQFLHFGRNK